MASDPLYVVTLTKTQLHNLKGFLQKTPLTGQHAIPFLKILQALEVAKPLLAQPTPLPAPAAPREIAPQGERSMKPPPPADAEPRQESPKEEKTDGHEQAQ
jgi:hypothetical protein